MHWRNYNPPFYNGASSLLWQVFDCGEAACVLKQTKLCKAWTCRRSTERCVQSMSRNSHSNVAICVIPIAESLMTHGFRLHVVHCNGRRNTATKALRRGRVVQVCFLEINACSRPGPEPMATKREAYGLGQSSPASDERFPIEHQRFIGCLDSRVLPYRCQIGFKF